MSNLTIGFANQYYTLWSVTEEANYVTDAYGNSWKSQQWNRFTYIKNVSKDLEKVKELYPNTSIDDGLRGKSISFDGQKSPVLPEGYFWFGKYYGHTIEEVIETDFNYCLWAIDNTHIKGLKDHPKVLAHFKAQEDAKAQTISGANPMKVGKATLTFTSNGFNAWWSDNGRITSQYAEYWDAQENGYDRCHIKAVSEGSDINFIVVSQGLKEVYGRFPYMMPMVNGKCQRTKNKTIEVDVYKVDEPKIMGNYIEQVIYIK